LEEAPERERKPVSQNKYSLLINTCKYSLCLLPGLYNQFLIRLVVVRDKSIRINTWLAESAVVTARLF